MAIPARNIPNLVILKKLTKGSTGVMVYSKKVSEILTFKLKVKAWKLEQVKMWKLNEEWLRKWKCCQQTIDLIIITLYFQYWWQDLTPNMMLDIPCNGWWCLSEFYSMHDPYAGLHLHMEDHREEQNFPNQQETYQETTRQTDNAPTKNRVAKPEGLTPVFLSTILSNTWFSSHSFCISGSFVEELALMLKLVFGRSTVCLYFPSSCFNPETFSLEKTEKIIIQTHSPAN